MDYVLKQNLCIPLHPAVPTPGLLGPHLGGMLSTMGSEATVDTGEAGMWTDVASIKGSAYKLPRELVGDGAKSTSASCSSPELEKGAPISTRSSLKSSSAFLTSGLGDGAGGMVIRSAIGMSSSSPSHADRETFSDIQSGRGSSSAIPESRNRN